MSSNYATNPMFARLGNLRMRMFDPRLWPLTVRLTLLFSASMVVILLTVSSFLYEKVEHQIYQKDQTELQHAIALQEEMVRTLENNQAPGMWQQKWREHMEKSDRLWFRLTGPGDPAHTGTSETSELSGVTVPFDKFPAVSSSSHPEFKIWKAKKVGGNHPRYMLANVAITTQPGRTWSLQAALDVTQSRAIINEYWEGLALMLCAVTIFSTCFGFFVAHKGLAPVRAISSAIERISIEKLDTRIGNQPWPSDLRVLAQTFDAMLGRLENSFDQLSRFSSDLAHEFRSPINNLVAAAGVTLSRDRDAADYKDTLATVVDEGERLSRMVSGMLFLARTENATQAIHLETLQTGDEFKKVLDFFEALAEEKDVTLNAHGDLVICADPLLLRRALSNLIMNALRYTPPKGHITLRAEPSGAMVSLSVSDSGAGIGAEHLPHLFDRFYRADISRSSGENTGLGLAVTKSIVELHGGSIDVTSTVGSGTCFTFTFPAKSHAITPERSLI
ncbi:two-component system, OmpR family, heavy metal sensor histidine kinase CusS [Collimonas sp. OK607]|uniref:heavy metal sensor histidine kinase n=1 Tax=Collimonas sp. OK607 TaxID=1798194 RepID=UPI0008F0339E|nr:heavy metal sensor histidine kinase [Collimonas sp. OK607]SFA73698.1 two-component system, OmpR family, heavy metal sensor histidine kinase CusS [Collimonas sp. OK607]